MAEDKVVSKDTKYYFSTYSGLSVMVDGDPQNAVRFAPFEEIYQGDPRRVGYLATDNKRAQVILDTDVYVETLTEKEYVKATTGDKAVPLTFPISG